MRRSRPTRSAEAQRTITWETGLPNVDVRLVHAAVAGAAIDGYAVTNPVGFQGRHLRVSVFNAYAPLVHLGALESVVERARSAAHQGRRGALRGGPFHLRRAGRPVRRALHRRRRAAPPTWPWCAAAAWRAHACSPSAARAFTKSLADRLDTSFEDAERIKIDHAEGREVDAPPTRSPRSSARTSPCGQPASSWCSRSSARKGCCRAASSSAAVARRCPRSAPRWSRRVRHGPALRAAAAESR